MDNPSQKHQNTEHVKLAAHGQWGHILRHTCGLTEQEIQPRRKGQPCPNCQGHDRYEYKSHQDGYHLCRGCGAGDGFSMIMKIHDCSFLSAIHMVADYLRLDTLAMGQAPRKNAIKAQDVKRQQQLTQQKQEAASAEARELLARAIPADSKHSYLITKGIKPTALQQIDNRLVIPVYAIDGQLSSVQLIAPDGTKRFLTGGKIKGCFHLFGNIADAVYIAEGVATASTVHNETGTAVAAAFFATNLKPVALAFRHKYPEIAIIIAADNDRFTPGNPGLTLGQQAARAVNGYLVYPTFPHGTSGTDFNDLAIQEGRA